MRNRATGRIRRRLLGSIGWALALAVLSAQAQAQETEQIRYELEGAERAEVELRPARGELRLSALEGAEALIEGTIETRDNVELQREFRVEDGVAELLLEHRRRFPFVSFGDGLAWDLALSPALPLDLEVEAGLGRTELDLTGLDLSELEVSTGVGESVITLPAEGRFEARVSTGVGATTIRIPEELAARIRVSTGLGSTNVLGDFRQQDDVFLSPDYETAEDRVDLEVEGGVGEVTIVTVD